MMLIQIIHAVLVNGWIETAINSTFDIFSFDIFYFQRFFFLTNLCHSIKSVDRYAQNFMLYLSILLRVRSNGWQIYDQIRRCPFLSTLLICEISTFWNCFQIWDAFEIIYVLFYWYFHICLFSDIKRIDTYFIRIWHKQKRKNRILCQ
jgi:hypothetical protein